MNYSKLRGKIKEVFGTQESFAEAMGMNKVSMSHRLNGKLEWKTTEIYQACKLLQIPLEDNASYFFVPEVKKSWPIESKNERKHDKAHSSHSLG